MPDQARIQTDKELNKIEKEIYSIYSKSADEISAKWYKYMESHERTLNTAYKELQDAKKSGDQDTIKSAQENYERTVKNITLNNDRYKAMLNETTAKLAHVNEIALDYVNGNMPKIYTLNYNEFANQDIDGYTFTLVNEQAVKDLATEDKSLLPKKKLDVPKDKQWNQKNINSEILQGILQGESISTISSRLQHVTDMNRSSAIRNARTMVTSAENKGRQDSFKKAQEDGVIMEREWVATNDERTRAWHADLDGVRVDIEEPWENEYGEIMYPGDPSADPANVYNCRCSIRAHVKGFKWNQTEDKEEEVEEVEAIKEAIIPTNAEELSEKWGIPVSGLQGDVIKNMDDALTFMQDEFKVNPSEYISMIDNKNPERMRNYEAYYSPWDKGIHLHKEYSGGKWGSLSPEVSAHEITHALNGYLSVLETKNHTVHHFDKIADEIMVKVFSENGYTINNRTGLPFKEDVSRTITKYGSTDSLEALADSTKLMYQRDVLGLNIKHENDMFNEVFNEVKRRLEDDIK